MGADFEVSVWTPQHAADPIGWRWEHVYYGNSRLAALWAWAKAVTTQSLPVKVIWR